MPGIDEVWKEPTFPSGLHDSLQRSSHLYKRLRLSTEEGSDPCINCEQIRVDQHE